MIIAKEIKMKILNVESVGKKQVYDISVADVEHYVLENGAITHNTGGMYSSNTVFIIGRAQEKDGTELAGYKFTINIEKSRFVYEKSKFPFYVYKDSGINKWSGLLDLAVDMGFVIKPKAGWYTRPTVSGDKNWRADATNCEEFWAPIIDETNFDDALTQKFALGNNEEEDEVDAGYSNDDI